MAKTKKGNVLGYVLMCIVLVGLVLAVVGMFVGHVAYTHGLNDVQTEYFKLFDSTKWGVQKIEGGGISIDAAEYPSNALGIVGFILALVGLAVILVADVFKNCLKKNGTLVTVLRIAGVALALVGAVLVFVSGFVMADGWYFGKQDTANKLGTYYKIGPGAVLGFVGGLVGAVAGALPLLKPFKG